MPRSFWTAWLAALLLATTVRAGTYYVAADAKSEPDGSKEKPWPSVAVALTKVGGGHTILVRPGLYRGPIEIGKQYAGRKAHPTIVRSEVKWKAVILGAALHGITTADGCDYVIVDGFEVLGARHDGIKMNGDANAVRNCWVHNNGCMGIAMHDKNDGAIEGNLVEFNGCHVQLHHGVYASGRRLSVRRNLIRHNASYGLHLYPAIKGSVIAQNVIHGHANKAGILIACPEGGGLNVITNNTVVGNAGAVEIWGGNREVVVNNILVARTEVLALEQGTRNTSVDYNLCWPKSAHGGPHDVNADPLFVDAGRGVFWLSADSPARGKGTASHSPDTDFWGRPAPTRAKPDLGAFAFVPLLTTKKARADWHQGWPYRFIPQDKLDMPDLWMLPPAAP